MAKKKRGHKSKPTTKSSKLAAQRQEELKRSRSQSRENNLGEDVGDEGNQKKIKSTGSQPVRGRGDSGKILLDPHRVRSDIKLVEQSIRQGWNVRRKTMVRRRLEEIVAKTEAEVVTKEGVISLESAGDKISIEAAKVLVSMDSQDQSRVKNSKNVDGQSTTVNINVNNINTSDPKRIELARLAHKFGARELIIEGESVPISEITGEADPVERDETSDRTSE